MHHLTQSLIFLTTSLISELLQLKCNLYLQESGLLTQRLELECHSQTIHYSYTVDVSISYEDFEATAV